MGNFLRFTSTALLWFSLQFAATAVNAAPRGKIIYTFQGGSAAQNPASLVVDASGNLFGIATDTNSGDGCLPAYCPVAFQLSPGLGGTWAYSILYRFSPGVPVGGLILDKMGNLYGTQREGGSNNYGLVFELSPRAGGAWTETVLYNFGTYPDGENPDCVLSFDATGSLYGSTLSGGTNGRGTVFELSANGEGGWNESIIWSFNESYDGEEPTGPLTLDAFGNVYGTTSAGGNVGGAVGTGTAFQLLHPSIPGEAWTRNVLHSFGGFLTGDVSFPLNGVILDSAGNVYGSATAGGLAQGGGGVFELTPGQGGAWTEYLPCRYGTKMPCEGYANIVFDSAGNIYGENTSGGAHNFGNVYRLTPRQNRQVFWRYADVYDFSGNGDGDGPLWGLVTDSKGHLFGITCCGGNAAGSKGFGVIFEANE